MTRGVEGCALCWVLGLYVHRQMRHGVGVETRYGEVDDLLKDWQKEDAFHRWHGDEENSRREEEEVHSTGGRSNDRSKDLPQGNDGVACPGKKNGDLMMMVAAMALLVDCNVADMVHREGLE